MRCRMPQVGSTDKDLGWFKETRTPQVDEYFLCLLYTSDAADEAVRVDLGGRRIIKKIFFQAEDGIRDLSMSRGLGDVYKRQSQGTSTNYYLILGLRDKAAPPTSQQITNKKSPRSE